VLLEPTGIKDTTELMDPRGLKAQPGLLVLRAHLEAGAEQATSLQELRGKRLLSLIKYIKKRPMDIGIKPRRTILQK
jgi:hypothetical protein